MNIYILINLIVMDVWLYNLVIYPLFEKAAYGKTRITKEEVTTWISVAIINLICILMTNTEV